MFPKTLAVSLISAGLAAAAVLLPFTDRPNFAGEIVLLSAVAVLVVATALSYLVARSAAAPLRRVVDRLEERKDKGVPMQVEVTGSRDQRALARAVNRMASELAAGLEELRSETQLREQILASMSVGVVLHDLNGTPIYSNPAAAELLGISLNLPPEALEPGETEFAVFYPSRRELRTLSVKQDDGRRLVLVSDVTEAKRVESMRRDFVADASHELKTPVGAILATAETLEIAAREDPPKAARFISSLLHEARRVSRLVEELLDLARLEQPAEEAEARPVHLSGLVRREVANAAFFAKSKGLELRSDIAGGVIVPGRVEDLALAIRNVLDNALRYTNEGRVSVTLERQNGRALVKVVDTGIGIAGRDLERIFERFYRVDPARSRQTGGTGLGLSIARHALERYGGQITATSRLGEGSVFLITLPSETGAES